MISRAELDDDKQPVWTEPNFRIRKRFAWVRQWKSEGPGLFIGWVLFCLVDLIVLGALK